MKKTDLTSRRHFLKASLAVIGLTTIGAMALAAWNWRTVGFSMDWYLRTARDRASGLRYSFSSPAQRIKQYFDYLTIDEAGLRRFVADYEKRFGKVKFSSTLGNSHFYSTFLLSTDFFLNGADESRTVRYVSLHDAYVTPCLRPFS